ncbi:MAG: phosphoglycerate mutase, partial [Pseudomonadota bacterium]|nr:phosphoglycerate mutase [Pseudomonadota bacterium]
GKLPVNSLWFWGGGVLPDFVQRSHDVVCTDEETMRALAAASLPSSPETGSIPPQPLPPRFATVAGDALFDLQAERDLARLQDGWLEPALLAAQRGELDSLQIDFADGAVFTIKRMQRWRIWRKPLASLNP